MESEREREIEIKREWRTRYEKGRGREIEDNMYICLSERGIGKEGRNRKQESKNGMKWRE